MNWYENKIKKYEHYKTFKTASDIKILYPGFAFLILKLFINAYKEGLEVCIFETYRSQERQLDLFNKGKTTLKKNGMHHFGVAADIVFRNENNHPIWKGDWDKLGQIGKDLGLFWGGDWESFRDYPHFQLIPALYKHQVEIIIGNYPPYDNKIDAYIEKIMSHYDMVKNNNYSEEHFKKLISCYDDLSKMPKKREAEKINILPKKVYTTEQKENRVVVWRDLLNLLVNLFRKR